MDWYFDTAPEFQPQLNWIEQFVREEVEPLDHILLDPWDIRNPNNIKLVRPLQAQVKQRKLWACHLGPELGGEGYGQVRLGLMNELIGRSRFGPIVFGCQAPDTGNAEILAHYGTDEQKKRYLQPLLDNDIISCFSMTEPQSTSDPKMIETSAVLDGDHWVISGNKWFSSNATHASFIIVMAVTDPEASDYRRMSMFIVPSETPGINIIRDVSLGGADHKATHAFIRYDNVRVPLDHMLGERGDAFVVAQTRLGGGRIHHAMRTVGECRKVFDMMCERVQSRFTQGERLSEKQMVQEKIADSWIEIEQFRLLVLRTAWLIDKYQDYQKVRKDIAAIKALMPRVLHDVTARALHLHGSIGISGEMPFVEHLMQSFAMGLADGPTEVHKITVAKQVLRDYAPSTQMFPDYHLPAARERALAKYGRALGLEGEI